MCLCSNKLFQQFELLFSLHETCFSHILFSCVLLLLFNELKHETVSSHVDPTVDSLILSALKCHMNLHNIVRNSMDDEPNCSESTNTSAAEVKALSVLLM